ncbi:AIPR family protein [Proteinivorax hydrogeniformans]|uniref:AIPR family protein n=1 Tax=Proteinivorax hydrogeniformans TaxID=1826727 RepID=A0AAU8HX52_9FIRM
MVLENHRENIIRNFINEVVEEMNDNDRTLDASYTRVAAKWIGYELDEENFVDGSGDRGLDFWYQSYSVFDLFQVKTLDSTESSRISGGKFDKAGLLDLKRIKAYLTDEEGIPEHNNKLKLFKERWNHVVSSKRLAKKDSEENTGLITVNLGLIIIGNELTVQAMEEFDAFQRSLASPIKIHENVEIEFNLNLYDISYITDAKWRENNREWRNIDGKKQDWIKLQAERNQFLNNSLSSLFYCPAINLVSAYQDFGYQLFEPNVRCNIKKSKVNSAIRESIKHYSSRKEFRYLNNGVTIICKNYSSPSKNRDSFKVNEPGIVNGLQTVISLSEAYNSLSNEEKEDFEENCYVLVRLLRSNAVRNVDKVVRSTNTQNKMEPRNLLSNNPEQILYEKLFAKKEIGWFYERKQGSWDAFANDPRRWRTLQNKRKADFLSDSNDLRTKARVVDNETIAQTWMSFIGFSDIAVHEKSKLFEREEWYNLVFLHSPIKHGYDYKYNLQKLKQDANNEAPPPELLLISHLARSFARQVTPSKKENFESACKRLNINPNSRTREEVIAELSNDSEYLLGLALSGMSYTFVEYLGFALFRALGTKLYDSGQAILKNGAFATIHKTNSFKKVQEQVKKETFSKDDILCVAWFSFKHVLNEMLSSFWAESFRSTSNKSRFLANKDTRLKIVQGLEDLHRYTCQVQITKLWAAGIEPEKGIYGFIKDKARKGR